MTVLACRCYATPIAPQFVDGVTGSGVCGFFEGVAAVEDVDCAVDGADVVEVRELRALPADVRGRTLSYRHWVLR
jgi:hypothetical protein